MRTEPGSKVVALADFAADAESKRLPSTVRARAEAHLDTLTRDAPPEAPATGPSAVIVSFEDYARARLADGTHPAVRNFLAGIENAQLSIDMPWLPGL